MLSCTFFGHKECPDDIRGRIKEVIRELIETKEVRIFYVGNQGNFDALVYNALREIEKEYPEISYSAVLAYMPLESDRLRIPSKTMLPEGIEGIHPKYAIAWRNDWMLKRSTYVVTYVTHSWGGAAKYAEKARKMGRTVIELL